MTQRNPYLLLGVDYGTPADEARRSFARAARRVRRAPESPITVEDLNWALHQVQHLESDPADAVDVFRVPADPAVFEPGGTGLFTPEPVPLPRGTETTEQDRDVLRAALADELTTLLAEITPRLLRVEHGYRDTREDNR